MLSSHLLAPQRPTTCWSTPSCSTNDRCLFLGGKRCGPPGGSVGCFGLSAGAGSRVGLPVGLVPSSASWLDPEPRVQGPRDKCEEPELGVCRLHGNSSQAA